MDGLAPQYCIWLSFLLFWNILLTVPVCFFEERNDFIDFFSQDAELCQILLPDYTQVASRILFYCTVRKFWLWLTILVFKSSVSGYGSALIWLSWIWVRIHLGISDPELVSMNSVTDLWCLYQIPDPNFSIPDPGSKWCRNWIRIKEFKYFVSKLLEIWPGVFIPDPGVKKHRIPYPDPHWLWNRKKIYTFLMLILFPNLKKKIFGGIYRYLLRGMY